MTEFRKLEELSWKVAEALTRTDGESGWSSLEGFNSGQRRLSSAAGDDLTMSEYNGRLYVRGWVPATAAPDVQRCSIGVDPERGAEVIARSIVQRLLPKYRPELRRVLDYNAAMMRQHTERGAVLAQLAEALGGSYQQLEYSVRSDRAELLLARMPGSVGGSITATGTPDSVDMTLRNVPADVARRMLAVLGTVVWKG